MKILFSFASNHHLLKRVFERLSNSLPQHKLFFHDPSSDYFNLREFDQRFGDFDLFVVKVVNDFSLDMLQMADIRDIPTLHGIEHVNRCKNKIALDQMLRTIMDETLQLNTSFLLPESWIHNVSNENFVRWAEDKVPFVIKSHYQHDIHMRYNFLVKNIQKDISYFKERYARFQNYDQYIQKFVECDGYDRKIYVVGEKVFGIRRENPIYVFLRNNPQDIDVSELDREPFSLTPEIKSLAHILKESFHLELFGFDLVKSIHKEGYYIIDLNDFPGYKGVENIENELIAYFTEYFAQMET